MELILVVVGAIVVTAIAHRRGLEPALILVVVGFAVSFAPEFEGIELESEVLLSVVLPPLLYSAALDFSFPTFLRNIRPILGLGVGLVVITAFAVAGVASWLVPSLTFGTALILGAVVAPPDAVTAVAVGRRLGLPKKVMAILTGESLVNDAAALSLFSIAVAQVAGSRAFIENPLLLFGYSAVLGPLVGAALGYITLWIRRRLAHPGLETIQGLVVPFAAFISAEHLHASGVLAVVVAGFVVGHGSLEAGYQTRLQERYVWNSVDVMLEAFVFAYIGLQLRFVLEDLHHAHESLVEVALASGVVLLVVLAIRPACVFLMFGRGVLFRHVENQLSVPVPVGWARRARYPQTQDAGQVVGSCRPPLADVARERGGVLDRDARRGDFGGRIGHSADDRRRRPVPRAGHHPGDRLRRQRRHAAPAGLDTAAADSVAGAVVRGGPRLRRRRNP